MLKLLAISFIFVCNASAFEVKEKLLKVQLKDSLYEVIIKNKAAFYTADLGLKDCLFLGLKEDVQMNIDPLKLKILTCSVGVSAQNVQNNKTQ